MFDRTHVQDDAPSLFRMKEVAPKETGSEVHIVHDPNAAALLANRRALVYLSPFLGREHSLSKAATELEVRPSTVAYWLPRFVDAGLVRAVRTERRAGMPSKRYRAVASRIVLPAGVLPADVAHRFFGQLRQVAERQLVDALGRGARTSRPWAVEFTRDERAGGMSTRLVSQDRSSTQTLAMLDMFDAVRLGREDAHALVQDLRDVVERYKERGRGARRYLVHLGLAPHPG